jgi:hypothetical protein
VCALAGHAVVYRSLWPDDGVHGYFGWYEMAVGVLSAVALGTIGVVVLLGALGASGRRVDWVWALVRARGPAMDGFARSAATVAWSSLALLLFQESVERSVLLGRPAVVLFAPSTWLLLAPALGLFAAALVWLTRSCATLLEIVFASGTRPVGRGGLLSCPPAPRLTSARRRNPLASRGGMRAPPSLVG